MEYKWITATVYEPGREPLISIRFKPLPMPMLGLDDLYELIMELTHVASEAQRKP